MGSGQDGLSSVLTALSLRDVPVIQSKDNRK